MIKEVEFKLESPVKVSVGPEIIEEHMLLLRSPPLHSEKAKILGIKLKALALAAIGKASKEWGDENIDESAKEEAANDNGDKMLIGFASVGIDILPLIEIMKELSPVVIKIGEGHSFTTKNWSLDMSGDDQIRVTGVFVKNFCLASYLSNK